MDTKSSIYLIKNKENGRIWVFSTIDLDMRDFKIHVCDIGMKIGICSTNENIENVCLCCFLFFSIMNH